MARLATDIMARIEWLTTRAREYSVAKEAGDIEGLLRVAAEYATHEKTVAISTRIMLEVAVMRERQAAHEQSR